MKTFLMVTVTAVVLLSSIAAMACPAGTHPVCTYTGIKSVCYCAR